LVAAFGDFNGNKNTDIFVIADGGNLNSFCTWVILDCLIPWAFSWNDEVLEDE
jgi:hypothetical protein